MIKDIARMQLAAWQELALTWTVYYGVLTDPREVDKPVKEDQAKHAFCGACQVSIYQVTDQDGREFAYEPGQELAMIVMHLRNRHRDLETTVYQTSGVP